MTFLSDSPIVQSIPYDGYGMPLAVSGGSSTANRSAFILAGEDVSSVARFLKLDDEGRLKVVTAISSEEPLYVVPVTGSRSYYGAYLTKSNLPAKLDSVNAGPYQVGGDTLNINVNAVADSVYFATRGATSGVSISSFNPAISNGDLERFKLSVDGGAAKEVKIAKNLADGFAIAAALQAKIQAEVPNGSAVLVDYNSTYIGRYTITSGTTGTSSKIRVLDSDVARVLKMGVANSGTEIDGLAANYYSTDEIVDTLTTELSDVLVSNIANKIRIETVLLGASASLQVTGGTANTDFAFSTSLVNGSTSDGSTTMTANGSLASPVRYGFPKHATRKFHINKLTVEIKDPGAVFKTFGSAGQLTNGVQVEVRTESEAPFILYTFKTNAQILSLADDGSIIADAFADNHELVSATFRFEPGIAIRPGTLDDVVFIIRDNLSGISSFTVLAEGWLE